MLYIRTDGNADIGTGHVMRCLSIAKANEKNGIDCTFIVADDRMKPWIEEQGFSVVCLDSLWNDLDVETDKMVRLIKDCGIERLLIDSYFVTFDYLSRLHRLTYITYIDDLDDFIYPCSELINYNIYAEKLDYPARYPNTRLLLGPKYAPLREEFRGLSRRINRNMVEHVLLTVGGADPLNIATQIVERVKQDSGVSNMHYHIVAGRFMAQISRLSTLAKKYEGVTIHQHVEKMSVLMRDCDVAISAGGTTLYEICACGVPTVILSIADNQRMAVSAFSDSYMLGCGDFRDGEDKCLKKVTTNLLQLVGDYDLRRSLSEKCFDLVSNPTPLLFA